MFSRHAAGAELLLYETAESLAPIEVIRLDPEVNRTFYSWHVYVEGLPAGTHYTWRLDGPGDAGEMGLHFDRNCELLDPWAHGVTTNQWDRRRAKERTCQPGRSMRAVVVDRDYDWEGDQPLHRHSENSILYELHVGGFTRHPSSDVAHPGTFAGVIEKIPYLKDLGVTHVELLPVMAFDEQDVPDRAANLGLKNYWGYSTHSFFSTHPGYCISPGTGGHVREFRDMVKALHRAGIGVVLDVVFNHTAEGGADGPVINFKGIGNRIFYHCDPRDRRLYQDYTGCGNTVNCNHPIVVAFITGCLEYWVEKMHVDGFRFDLASVLARGEGGVILRDPPVLWAIELSDVLAQSRIIAEAWDAAGLYQVGTFPGYRWAEWNGTYRDVIRRFVRGDGGLVGEAATCVSGSSNLYEPHDRLPINSINFVTCHDGFTLHDLVSYDRKHNEANGEDNRDGSDANLSWNCGDEGETDDPQISSLREQQARNFMAILLLSHGLPMILAGDEVLRTQRGNNNAYCQDNDLSWFDWTLTEKRKDMLRFVRQMIAFRKRHPALMRRRFLKGAMVAGRGLPDVSWHGVRLHEPLWHDPSARLLAYTLAGVGDDEEDLHIILNMADAAADVALPPLPNREWHRAIDTSLPSPEDIMEAPRQKRVETLSYVVHPRSVVVFESRCPRLRRARSRSG